MSFDGCTKLFRRLSILSIALWNGVSGQSVPKTICRNECLTCSLLTDLRVPQVFDLDRAGVQDAQIFTLLSGRKPRKLVVIVTKLLTDAHSSILRAIQVRITPFHLLQRPIVPAAEFKRERRACRRIPTSRATKSSAACRKRFTQRSTAQLWARTLISTMKTSSKRCLSAHSLSHAIVPSITRIQNTT